ncbi:MAG: ABC transporter ATP-binding protein [Burkholderiaceae bacterium]|nr:ABC transporter ATP-binding protein [Burkholderiaceae bacterium]
MARIDLDLAHAYGPNPQQDSDYALLPLKMTFADGGAYALLGPSGCGKTTMLNIMSGLLQPSHGTVKFDGVDVTAASPQARNIAQVFQFPVIYDTMTVAENLAFPLRNRKVPEAQIKQRVGVIAEMLEMSGQLDQRAANLSADAKQKISLGRGLVRSDVSAVLFDEPLTVIDPHLKWQLRRKLKQIHHELKLTLIYVTHDQVEALTFADQVVVMTRGRAVQVGSAEALFERPQHTFVGHFIGSPGMNFLPVIAKNGQLQIAGQFLTLDKGLPAFANLPEGDLKLGVRPEYVALTAAGAPGALPVQVTQVQDIGTYVLVTARIGEQVLKARLAPDQTQPKSGEQAWFQVLGTHSCFYKNEELLA